MSAFGTYTWALLFLAAFRLPERLWEVSLLILLEVLFLLSDSLDCDLLGLGGLEELRLLREGGLEKLLRRLP